MMPPVDESTDPAAPWRIVYTSGGLDADATVVPAGPVRIAVTDRGDRTDDLVVSRRGAEAEVLGRIPPGSADRSAEIVVDLAPGDYVLHADTVPVEPFRIEFSAQPAPD